MDFGFTPGLLFFQKENRSGMGEAVTRARQFLHQHFAGVVYSKHNIAVSLPCDFMNVRVKKFQKTLHYWEFLQEGIR